MWSSTASRGAHVSASKQWQLASVAARRYEEILVPAILGPVARILVEETPIEPGHTVVDIGCGTGAAARLAAPRAGSTGRVIGLDVNEGMIQVARSLSPIDGVIIEWIQDDAYTIPLEDDEVDTCLCSQTVQFLPRPDAALSEMFRVLKPAGTVHEIEQSMHPFEHAGRHRVPFHTHLAFATKT